MEKSDNITVKEMMENMQKGIVLQNKNLKIENPQFLQQQTEKIKNKEETQTR